MVNIAQLVKNTLWYKYLIAHHFGVICVCMCVCVEI